MKTNQLFPNKVKAAIKISSASLCLTAINIVTFAQSVGFAKEGGTVDVEWPWTKMLNSLAEQFTGPVPTIIGILALVGAGFALLNGSHGQATSKLLGVVFAVGIALAAPNLINAVTTSAGGLTIFGL